MLGPEPEPEVDPDLARFAVDHATGQDGVRYAEARLEAWDETSVLMRNGQLDAAERSKDEGIGVRVLTDAGMGFCSADRLDRDAIRGAVDEAVRNAAGAARRAPLALADVDPVQAHWHVPQRRPLQDLSVEDRLHDLGRLDEAFEAAGTVPMRLVQSEDAVVRKVVCTSEGTLVESLQPIFHLFYYITVKEGARTRQAHRSFGHAGGWEGFAETDVVDRATDEVEGLTRHLREGRATRPRRVDLVVGPEVAGIAAHESVGHPLEADRILGREASQAGTSFVTPGMRGDRIGSELVTVVDDPTVGQSYGHYVYDDEGVPARERTLVEHGRIGEFLHDRQTGAAMDVGTNASSRATRYDRENIVRMANTYVRPDRWSPDEILEEAGNGIYMRSFTEWNIDDRRWHQRYVAREAYRIEDGELGDPVDGLFIETTTPAFWGAVRAVGDDLAFDAATCGKCDPIQGIPVTTGGPTLLLEDVPVGVPA